MVRDEQEAVLLRTVRHFFDQREPELASRGLRIEIDHMVRSQPGAAYDSEVVVNFLENDNLVDVLECHLFSDGRLAVTASELLQWLQSTFSDVLGRRTQVQRTGSI